MFKNTQTFDLTKMVAHIVACYVSNHDVDAEDLPNLIQLTAQSLTTLSHKESRGLNLYRPDSAPAVAVEDSLHPDYIICLEDGRRMKTLKRHLKTAYNMTPDQYRIRWGLSKNYPMIAPNYAKQRSLIAKSTGLGTYSSKNSRKVAA